MASQFDYDLFVIGAGSGGVRAARIAAQYGARVGIAEEYRIGGTCVIRGCVPKKLLVYSAQIREALALAPSYGWHGPPPQLAWADLRNAIQAEVGRLSGLYQNTLERYNVTLFESRAELRDPHTIDLGDKTVTARIILIATGARPVMPDIPGAQWGITSNDVFHLDQCPQKIIISGGGYIATEFAGIFQGLGSAVTQVYRGDIILRGWDDDLRTHVQRAMADHGVQFCTQQTITAIEKKDSGLYATLSSGDTLHGDVILHALGRQPNTTGLGLERAGVALNETGAIRVDAFSQSSVPHIYAVGDVTDRLQLTPIAIKEGHAFADSVFGAKPWHADWEMVPSAVFSNPPLASVGLTEAQARAQGKNTHIYRAEFKPMKTVFAGWSDRALCKLVVDAETDIVLGAHMLGADAPEIIQSLAIAVKMGVTKSQIDQTVAVHPTAAEEFVLMRTVSAP